MLIDISYYQRTTPHTVTAAADLASVVSGNGLKYFFDNFHLYLLIVDTLYPNSPTYPAYARFFKFFDK